MQDCKLVMLKAKIDKKTRPMQDSIKLNKNTSRCPSTPIPVLSEIFLSGEIPIGYCTTASASGIFQNYLRKAVVCQNLFVKVTIYFS